MRKKEILVPVRVKNETTPKGKFPEWFSQEQGLKLRDHVKMRQGPRCHGDSAMRAIFILSIQNFPGSRHTWCQ